ncbi:glycosyltransferase [Pelomicrobium methylotrophicum]|nr:glycosyltransferase [Pelomicrobium methylotrophicum]
MPDNRRVLLIASSLQAGGAERMISQMANAWAARGRQVAVLTLSGTTADHYVLHPAVERIGLDLLRDSHSLWEAVRWNMRRSQAIQRAVRRWRPDVVISFIVQMNVTVLVAPTAKHDQLHTFWDRCAQRRSPGSPCRRVRLARVVSSAR